ncbi:MAG: hypothetical protein LBG31_06165, partial [Prevotellaceae bacterium]|nr:hypothetical protein [Prevotellaceae bacterium]
MNNPVLQRGGTRHPPAFRAAYCRCIVENPCAARGAVRDMWCDFSMLDTRFATFDRALAAIFNF